jgi:HAT1-interacting factor 1
MADQAEASIGQQSDPQESSTHGHNASAKDRLTDLTAKATAEYAVKHYKEAAELYSQATELQAEVNGEMSIDNADLLYSYGKCLFFLAQQSSNVLGDTAASAQLTTKKEPKSKKRKLNSDADKPQSSSLIGDAMSGAADAIPEEDVKPEQSASDKPFFQISGDDEGWDSDSDEEEEAEDDDEQDDFADAYEMLDIARVLYLRKLEALEQSALEDSDKGKYIASIDQTPAVRETKSRIADIHDLQAEVQLEGEKYALAVEDLQKCLALKEELEAPESALLAECHYKLSLALEFSSQSQARDKDGNPVGDIQIDWDIRNDAVVQQEKAIESCKLRVTKETARAETMEKGAEKDKILAEAEDVNEMVAEMETRLAELRKPPVNVKEEQMREQISGVLGSILGKTEGEKQEELAKASAEARDIGGLVKKKKLKSALVSGGNSGAGSAASTPAPSAEVNGNGKRKVGFADEAEGGMETKKARVEDVPDAEL